MTHPDPFDRALTVTIYTAFAAVLGLAGLALYVANWS